MGGQDPCHDALRRNDAVRITLLRSTMQTFHPTSQSFLCNLCGLKTFHPTYAKFSASPTIRCHTLHCTTLPYAALCRRPGVLALCACPALPCQDRHASVSYLSLHASIIAPISPENCYSGVFIGFFACPDSAVIVPGSATLAFSLGFSRSDPELVGSAMTR